MRITRVELIKEHQFYAYNLRLHDMVVDKYNIKDKIGRASGRERV